jgi:hypothetical protein
MDILLSLREEKYVFFFFGRRKEVWREKGKWVEKGREVLF